MTEGQNRRAIASGHKGFDAGACPIADMMDTRAVDGLHRHFGSELIDGLMRIHDEEMHAVGAAAACRCHGINVA